RVGLGWTSQFQVRVPYLHVKTTAGSAEGEGNIDFSLAKQLVSEGAASPSLVAALGWVRKTGRDGFDGEVATGSGFDTPYIGFTAVKRYDPLAFYGGLSYASPVSREISGTKLTPGDTVGLRLGSVLAASPDMSVNVGLNLGVARTARVDGERVPDSDETFGTLQIGFGSVLTRRVILNVFGDFRVTGNVPDFRLGVTLPVRF
ncbi:MAG TPA: hypothetical protein VFB93_22690, partial [Burkholderiales bacterium]|nr:hypothetical protein [Burkholderiales bacterium]